MTLQKQFYLQCKAMDAISISLDIYDLRFKFQKTKIFKAWFNLSYFTYLLQQLNLLNISQRMRIIPLLKS